MASKPVIRFGVFELDLGARELRKRGVRVRLQDQPFRVLEALLEKPGEIVTREELKERLWAQDEFVEFDKSLNTSVQKIRQALGDSADSPRFLETVPRLGYRFVAPVDSPAAHEQAEKQQEQPPAASPPRSRLVIGTLAVATIAAIAGALLFSASNEAPAPYLRFTLDAPGIVQEAAISPDGRSVAYVSVVGPQRRLYIQDLDEDAPRIPNIEHNGIFDPVWSDDSERIFVRAAGSTILSVRAAAGPAEQIFYHVDGVRAIAYDGERDRVVFTAGSPRQFYSVPSEGGKAEPLLAEGQPIEGDAVAYGHASFPAASPPGTMLFDYSPFTVQRSMAVRDIHSGRQTLLGSGGRPTYDSSGHLLYQNGLEGIWAIPFDLRSLQATGDPFLVENRGVRPTVSRDGVMVFVERHTGGAQQLVWKDRSGRITGTIGRPQHSISVPDLSPDETRVVVEARDPSDPLQRDIWIHEVNTPLKSKITFGPQNESTPAWLPDGERIVYSAQRNGAMDIFALSAAGGGEPEMLVDGEGSQYAFDWTPDGSALIYDTPPQDIWVWELGSDGEGVKRPLVEDQFDTYAPDFSPDGRYFAYVSDESGQDEVYVKPYPEGDWRVQVSLDGGAQPRWRGDGLEIYYVDEDTLIAATVEPLPELRITERTELFADAEAFQRRGQQYDVSRDGRRFVVVQTVEERPSPKIRVVQNWYEGVRRARQD
jgi:Tol biopolymer transport system component/DNA-binding winged helix-turn-helix (wHTH) protein